MIEVLTIATCTDYQYHAPRRNLKYIANCERILASALQVFFCIIIFVVLLVKAVRCMMWCIQLEDYLFRVLSLYF